jgi:CYTH domain-containing protein
VVDNSTDFNGKIRRVMSTICQFVGLTGTVGMSKRKFLVKASCIKKMGDADSQKGDRIVFPDAIRYQKFEVDHDYILRPDQDQSHQLRLRRRGLNGQYTYSYTLRYPDLLGQRVELKRLVTRREYFDLLLQRDPATQTVTKKRYSFLHNNTYMELDQLCSPHQGLYLLEFHTEKDRVLDPKSSPLFPDFLAIEREVTRDPQYSMYALAKKSQAALQADSVQAMKDAMNRSKSMAISAHHGGQPSDMQVLLQRLASPSAPNSPQISGATATTQPEEHKL